MKIRQIITDYIRRSILTTHGDMVVRGAAIPERLAAVAVGQVLKSGGVGAKPAWGLPLIGDGNLAIQLYTRSTAGDEVVTGLGFQPKIVWFSAIDDTVANLNWSIGIDLQVRCLSLFMGQTLNEVLNRQDASIYIKRDAGNLIHGRITAFGSDGFTVTHALTGACVAYVKWLAIG